MAVPHGSYIDKSMIQTPYLSGGYIFDRWASYSDYNSPEFDFDNPINYDTSIYAQFVKPINMPTWVEDNKLSLAITYSGDYYIPPFKGYDPDTMEIRYPSDYDTYIPRKNFDNTEYIRYYIDFEPKPGYIWATYPSGYENGVTTEVPWDRRKDRVGIEWLVYPAMVEKPYIVSTETGSYEKESGMTMDVVYVPAYQYTGEYIYPTLYTSGDGTWLSGTDYYYFTGDGAPTNTTYGSSNPVYDTNETETHGPYSAYEMRAVLLGDGRYVWSDGSSDPLKLEWMIIPKKVLEPALTQTVYQCTGYPISPELNIDEDDCLISGDRTAILEGNYEITVALKDLRRTMWVDSYDYPTYSRDHVFTLNWEIQGEIPYPEKPTLVATSVNYTGNAITATVTGYNSETMNISGDKQTNAGDYTISVTPKLGKWSDGTTAPVTCTWKILPKSITPTVEDIPAVTYNGQEHKPTVVVKDGNKVLVSGEDYTVSYDNNVYANTDEGYSKAKAIVELKGNYTGTETKEFTINKKVISIYEWIMGKDYDGSPEANVKVFFNDLVEGDTLTEGSDYSVYATFVDGPEIGDHKAVEGYVSLYSYGTANNYVIENPEFEGYADITRIHLEVTIDDIESVTYNGKAQEPEFVVRRADDGSILTKGVDYTFYYDKNIDAYHQALVHIDLQYPYQGTKEKLFEIKKVLLGATLIVSDKEYDGSTNAECTVEFTGLISGETLALGTDYTLTDVTFEDAEIGEEKNVTATVSFLPFTTSRNYYLNNYTLTNKADIKFKNLNIFIEDIPDQLYKGQIIEPDIVIQVSGDDIELQSGDYDIEYTNNNKVGIATVTVTLKGNYVGSATKNFNIVIEGIDFPTWVTEDESQIFHLHVYSSGESYYIPPINNLDYETMNIQIDPAPYVPFDITGSSSVSSVTYYLYVTPEPGYEWKQVPDFNQYPNVLVNPTTIQKKAGFMISFTVPVFNEDTYSYTGLPVELDLTYDSGECYISGDYDASSAGEHTFYVGLKDTQYHAWKDENPVSQYVYEFTYEIVKTHAAMPGDIDYNGVINVQDIRLLISIYATVNDTSDWTEEDWYVRDINGDGIITVQDIRSLIQMYVR